MNITGLNIKKYYGENLVLNIDELKINKEKITGVTGPNGCGKSTLLNIIAGLDNNFLGKILYDEKNIDESIYDKITMVMQRPYLFKRTVFENIYYPLRIRKIDKDKIKQKVEKILYDLEIYDLKDKQAHKLSGGESQKVSLARALVFNPKVLFLDEPTSNIDPESIKIMEREIIRYNREKKGTVIIVTHNLEQSKRLCNEIIYLEKGRLKKDER
ncbi:putative ABC transporter ATP-binding protein [Gottschalkia acidurici 9a]|uniref:ABC transporter ATP-binding protein n=1 Tax=Gottschalkia acidurici (strain ATCC 7906 / DSM 604 / BCRC 14475 / CIP 104303 / KCTC 5404 / NCIMB 10678 / 9a) TaxID=1128398 RepID=K0B616_GOTA9|nr:ATP-binding cassette domain-containing protein [Gottschalkia acidurici]AFS79896.1 putative ABC transporter ATP-binding protein [Gottschalkia acidurici 9a]